MSASVSALSDDRLREFGVRFHGELIRPDSAAYESARKVWNGMIDRRPACIARCRTATDVQEAAKLCPADRLLVETDSPYLAPLPHRGKPNHPANVALVGAFLADLRGDDVGRLAATSTAATCLAFPLVAP